MTDATLLQAGHARARPHGARSGLRSLRPWLLAAMYGPLFAIFFRDSDIDTLDRLIAGATWLLCLWPAWQFVNESPLTRRPVPFFPMIAVVFGCYFPLQIVLGATNVYGRFEVAAEVPELHPAYYSRAVPLVFAGWVAVMIGHRLVSRRKRAANRREAISEELLLTRLGLPAFALLAVSLLIEVTKRTLPLSGGLRGILYFISSLSGVALALLVALAVQKRLRPGLRVPLFGAIALTMLLQASTGASQVVMLTVLTLGMSVVLAGGRLTWRWIALGVAGIALFAAMRGVALEHRKAMAMMAGSNAPSQTPLLFALIGERVKREGVAATVTGGLEIAVARSALADLFADVIRQTPEVVPYWEGETYKSLIGAFVPRALWPDKPMKTLGYAFGHRYGYLRDDDFTTTINFPFIIEFYANFASLGVLAGMFLVGLIYGAVERFFNRPGQSILRSLFTMALTIPLVNVESDFSLVFGGLFLNGCAMYALLWIARQRAPTVVLAATAGGERASGRPSAAASRAIRSA